MQHLILFFFDLDWSAALVAVSKTSLTPSLHFAEHSMYAYAPILLAIELPSSARTGSCFMRDSSRFVVSSFLRSFLFPTSMTGTLGQKCFTWVLWEKNVKGQRLVFCVMSIHILTRGRYGLCSHEENENWPIYLDHEFWWITNLFQTQPISAIGTLFYSTFQFNLLLLTKVTPPSHRTNRKQK